jgi:hypothetical protein
VGGAVDRNGRNRPPAPSVAVQAVLWRPSPSVLLPTCTREDIYATAPDVVIDPTAGEVERDHGEPLGVPLCGILNANFRELLFYALG